MQTMIRYKKLNPLGRAPELGSDEAAGYDVFANNIIGEDGNVLPGHSHTDDWEVHVSAGTLTKVGLGIALEIPMDRTVKIEARSGMSGRDWSVEGGRLDSDYRGEVAVLLRNSSPMHTQSIKRGQKIAQFLTQERIVTSYVEAAELTPTARGTGGFGSTGII